MNFTPSSYAKSRCFAEAVHSSQDHLYDGQHYLVHLDQTYNAFVTYPLNFENEFTTVNIDDVVAAIYTHDILDKTKISLDGLKTHFNETVVKASELMSKPNGSNRKERSLLQNKRFAGLNPTIEAELIALAVIAYERYANYNHAVLKNNAKFAKMYYNEAAAFKAATYRFNLCDDLWVEIDRLQERAKSRFNF